MSATPTDYRKQIDFMKSVTVVIPNWNGREYLKTCLDSLKNQDTDDFEILVIDNASEDGSAEFIRENYPKVRLLSEESNLGFSGGVNEGIKNSETPYVLLLNNDIEADPGFVRNLTAAIEKDDRIFSVSSRMINFRERELMDDAGDLYTILGWAFQRGVGQKTSDSRYLKPQKVFSACGGASIYRRKVFDEIGLFDLKHFAYLEDLDVGYRALLAGYRNMYEPSAIVYHIGSGASGATKYSDFKVRISARNSIYVPWKNMPFFQRILNAPFLALGRVIKRRFFKKLGFSAAYDEGVREGFETRGETDRVPFSRKRFFRYFYIEFLLIYNTFVYAADYFRRRGL